MDGQLNFICERDADYLDKIFKEKSETFDNEQWSFEKMHQNPLHVYLSGWCLGSSRENFDKLKQHYQGPWDEEFFAYFEDGDITWRAEEAGIRLGIYKGISSKYVYHFGRMTGKSLGLNNLYTESQKIIRRKWQDKFDKLQVTK